MILFTVFIYCIHPIRLSFDPLLVIRIVYCPECCTTSFS